MSHTDGFGLSLLALLAVAGCAGTPVPHEQMASSQAAIRGAEEVGANNLPQAELHLQLAKDQVDKARALIEDDENERARFVLMRAESDADVAIALAKENGVRTQAQQALQQVQILRQKAQ